MKKVEKKRTGAQIILDVLKDEGVQYVFGYPGGAVIPLYDALYSCPEIKHVIVRHEQAAAHMADAYARSTGKVGVCIATSGPGATNLVTGIATAYADSIPVVAITGQVKSFLIGNDAFQEADITGITRPITKHNYLVKKIADLPVALREAFYIARTGRPGPVLVDVPVDVSVAEYDGTIDPEMDLAGYEPKVEPDAAQIEAAAEAINAAERPLFYVGGGCVMAGAYRELRACVEKAKVPVALTLMGLGAFPGDDPLCLGMLGMHGTAYANFALNHADLLAAFGARFDDRVTGKTDVFAKNARIVHCEIDPGCISKTVRTQLPVLGDVRETLKRLLRYLKPRDRKEWFQSIEEWRRTHPLKIPNNDVLRAQYVIQRISQLTRGRAIVTTDVGQHQMWTAQFYTFCEPRHFLTSGGLGTMGFGLPAAIGAALGRPGEDVWCITGDGSIMMNIQELVTARRLRLPIKIAVINNGYLGMVRQWQEMFWKKHYSETVLSDSPDFVKVAEAFGCHAIRIEAKDKVDEAILASYKFTDAPTLLDCRVYGEENVFPMIPAGRPIEEMIYYPREPELV